jgi:hypothetical protein
LDTRPLRRRAAEDATSTSEVITAALIVFVLDGLLEGCSEQAAGVVGQLGLMCLGWDVRPTREGGSARPYLLKFRWHVRCSDIIACCAISIAQLSVLETFFKSSDSRVWRFTWVLRAARQQAKISRIPLGLPVAVAFIPPHTIYCNT